MKTVTLEQFIEFGPCWLRDWGGDEKSEAKLYGIAKRFPNGATAIDILKLKGVSVAEKCWCVLRPEFIDEPILHEFGCLVAERVLPLIPDEKDRALAEYAIAIKRRWLKGEATDKELRRTRKVANNVGWTAYYAGYKMEALVYWAASWAGYATTADTTSMAWCAAFDRRHVRGGRTEGGLDILIGLLEGLE